MDFDKDNKNLKSINLDDFSVEELKSYIEQLNNEINRAKIEVDKKTKLQFEAKKLFK